MDDVLKRNMPGEKELGRLMAGNRRYVTSRLGHPNQTAERRAELRDGQQPFAVILGCSDSRVPPEVIFDMGLGDLFVVRVAGNIIDDVVLGSIEYAASHLQTPLVMVLGHSNCGAIEASVSGGDMDGHLPSLLAAISPAVDEVMDQPGDIVNNAARLNAKMVSDQLRCSIPILSDLVHRGLLKIVPAYYDLGTGAVALLSEGMSYQY
ncbi:MAG: carbonic anhydrase [Thermodesulfobacteriota bacterium]|nr:carbonic anhydrase [Thermodesulfobacteriota bacterium]